MEGRELPGEAWFWVWCGVFDWGCCLVVCGIGRILLGLRIGSCLRGVCDDLCGCWDDGCY